MIDTPCKPVNASKPLKSPNSKACTRYTVDEENELTELVMKYRDVWKNKNHSSLLVQKHMWIQFLQYLHSKGWPRRNWIRIRQKGRYILRKLNKAEIAHQEKVSVSSSNSIENSSNHTVSSSKANRHISGQRDSVATNQSSVHQLTMPTLTPSPVIPITTNLSTSSFSFNQSHIQHDSSITTVPRIVNTFSTAHMPQHFVIAHDTLQSTTSNICGEVTTNVEAGSGVVDVAPVNRVALLNPVSISFGMANVQTVNAAPIQEEDALQPSCDQSSRIPPVTGMIDLSAMSDDEENLPELRGDRIETSVNPVDGFSEKSTESNTLCNCCSSLDGKCECERTPPSEVLIHKQMKCIDLKIEILQLKKQYWSEKLKLLSKC
ncbi:hypothetical protein KSF78_0005941 [Schistosoma japonicum]|nr:hypothetical protein KSF78_0005941 [Schistosoma japonicum]